MWLQHRVTIFAIDIFEWWWVNINCLDSVYINQYQSCWLMLKYKQIQTYTLKEETEWLGHSPLHRLFAMLHIYLFYLFIFILLHSSVTYIQSSKNSNINMVIHWRGADIRSPIRGQPPDGPESIFVEQASLVFII